MDFELQRLQDENRSLNSRYTQSVDPTQADWNAYMLGREDERNDPRTGIRL